MRNPSPRLAALAAAAVCAAVQLAFAYPAPDWLDSPELISAAVRLGTFHPPGAPLAVLGGHVFVLWPFAPPARGLLLFSAVWAALSVYLATRLVQDIWRELGPKTEKPALVAAPALGLAFGLGPGMMSQAVRCEVYTLGLLLCLACLRELVALASRTEQDPGRTGGRIDRAFALTGMGLAVHPLMALVPVPAMLVLGFMPRQRGLWWRPVLLARRIAFGLLGAAPLFLLPLMVRDFTDLRWGDPTGPAGWLGYVLGATFSPSFSPSADAVSAGGLHLLAVLGTGLGLPLLVLAAPGAYFALRGRPLVGSILLLLIAADASTLVLQRSFRLDNPDVTGYALPALAALVLFAAAGLASFARVLESVRPRLAWLGAAACALLALWAAIFQAPAHDRSGCASGRALALQTLERLPRRTVVLAADFNLMFMLDYLVRVEGVRQDVTVIYLRDLENPALRSALAAGRPDLEARLPRAGLLTADELVPLRAHAPLALDPGPHLDPIGLAPFAPAGLLWLLDPPAAPPDIEAARLQDRMFASHPPVCRDTGAPDPRFAGVVAWHGYWQGVFARRAGMPELAARMTSIARCASPSDRTIAAAAEDLPAPHPQACDREQPRAPPQILGARPGTGRALALLLGLLVWAGSLLLDFRRLWLPGALAGLALTAVALL